MIEGKLIGKTRGGAVVLVLPRETVDQLFAGTTVTPAALDAKIAALPAVHCFENETCDPVELE